MPLRDPAGGGSTPRGRRPPARSSRGFDAPVPGTAADDTPDADPEGVARSILLRKLTVAPRTRAQLADALTQRGVPDEVADATLDRFEDLGLVDDAEFARQWARSRQAGRGLARRALAYELRQRGVDDDLVKEALDDPELGDELETARDLVRRRLAAGRSRLSDPIERERQARRALGVLARKGYGGGVAARAVREALRELASVDAADALDGGLDAQDGPDGPCHLDEPSGS
jgi:regulatory protein